MILLGAVKRDAPTPVAALNLFWPPFFFFPKPANYCNLSALHLSSNLRWCRCTRITDQHFTASWDVENCSVSLGTGPVCSPTPSVTHSAHWFVWQINWKLGWWTLTQPRLVACLRHPSPTNWPICQSTWAALFMCLRLSIVYHSCAHPPPCSEPFPSPMAAVCLQ